MTLLKCSYENTEGLWLVVVDGSSRCSRLLQTACRCLLGFKGSGRFCYPINLCQQVRSVHEAKEKVLVRADAVPLLPVPCSRLWRKMLGSAWSKAALSSTTTSGGTSVDTSPFSTVSKMSLYVASILFF